MRWLVLVTGLVFSGAIAHAAFLAGSGEAVLSPLMLTLILVVSLLVFLLLYVRANSKSLDFEQWLDKNSSLVLSEGAVYNGHPINRDSEARIFLLTVSAIVMTSKMPSRPYFSWQSEFKVAQAAYTLISLVLGWWGIPWGPIYTVQAVMRNIEGGSRITVGEYLTHITKRRVVKKDSRILLLTKGLGAVIYGFLFALLSVIILHAAHSLVWVTYVSAALVGALATAWTWTYGRAWVK